MEKKGKVTKVEANRLEMLKQVAAGIAAQFGSNCEVIVHDVGTPDHSIIHIENGHVSGRKVGDGGSNVVMELLKQKDSQHEDHLGYLTRAANGKVLKSSTMYIRNSRGKVVAILSINFDISALAMIEGTVRELISPRDETQTEPEKIVNINDLLEDLIAQSVVLVGKPVALMNKEDKVRAIQFLNKNGAFLVTKSGDKIAKYFGISKYTLYSYIDTKLDS